MWKSEGWGSEDDRWCRVLAQIPPAPMSVLQISEDYIWPRLLTVVWHHDVEMFILSPVMLRKHLTLAVWFYLARQDWLIYTSWAASWKWSVRQSLRFSRDFTEYVGEDAEMVRISRMQPTRWCLATPFLVGYKWHMFRWRWHLNPHWNHKTNPKAAVNNYLNRENIS